MIRMLDNINVNKQAAKVESQLSSQLIGDKNHLNFLKVMTLHYKCW